MRAVYKLASEGTELVLWAEGFANDDPMVALGFSANGLVLNSDESMVYLGRADTGNVEMIPVEMDGTAGVAVTQVIEPALAEGSFGIDGMLNWRRTLVVVREGGVHKVVMGEAGEAWTLEAIAPAGELNGPTTVAGDNFGNLWIVEAQLGELLAGGAGMAPFRVVRYTTQGN